MNLTQRKPGATHLEWICENRLEILRYLETNPQARAANILGVSFGYLNIIIATWKGKVGEFPTYSGEGTVTDWLTANALSVQTLCKVFNNNYKMTAAYLLVPYPILRKTVLNWDRPVSELETKMNAREAEEAALTAQGVRPLPKAKYLEYLEQNATRKANDIKPLMLLTRSCLKCGLKFESAGDRLCGCTVGENSDYFWETWK